MISDRMGNLIISVILFGIGLYWTLVAQSMPPGELGIPGPGFFPTFLGIAICGISVAMVIYNWRKKKQMENIRVGHLYIWLTLGGIVIFSFFFERIGFVPIMILFIAFMLKLLSNLKPVLVVLLSICATLFAYLFFGSLLGIRLPPVLWL